VNYSIKDLERISGIKAHTLRIWEKRYDILAPDRTDTNIRTYGDGDLRKLLNIKTLLEGGWKISHVGQLDYKSMKTEVEKMFDSREKGVVVYEPFVNALTAAMLEINEREFDRIFTSATTRFGLREAMIHVVNPFLQRVGIMWSVREAHPGHEHFATNIIRKKLFSAIDQMIPMEQRPEKFMLFLPEGEHHEIGLLFANFWLRSEGFQVIYLGANVPFDSLSEVADTVSPENILTFFIANRPVEEVEKYLGRVCRQFSRQTIFIAGETNLLDQVKAYQNVKLLRKPDDLIKLY
jgi:DNA-binding transcriptional MerR regulator